MSEQRLNSDIHDEDNRPHVFHGPGGGDHPPDPALPRYQQQQQRRHDHHQNQNNRRGNHHHNGRGNYHNNRHRGNGQHHHNYQHHRNRHGGGLMLLAHTIASANLVSSHTAANTVRPYGPPTPVDWRYGGYDAPDHGQHLVSFTGKRSWDADPESPERERSSGEPAGWTRSERWRSAKRARQEDARIDRPWPDYISKPGSCLVAIPALPGPGAEGSALGLDLQGLGLGGNAPSDGDVDMRMFLPTEEEYQQALDGKHAPEPGELVRGTD
ncbi:hypothetical protein FRC08_002843 [Ceratobasidium sp. 394]|nr:hypothetical protein FRC08_002843 [Ceratobasidium sp. 394]KAG9079753.1 hypothetical protein FS749_008274 [Ceratobasidium sp. UAMH 11750]